MGEERREALWDTTMKRGQRERFASEAGKMRVAAPRRYFYGRLMGAKRRGAPQIHRGGGGGVGVGGGGGGGGGGVAGGGGGGGGGCWGGGWGGGGGGTTRWKS